MGKQGELTGHWLARTWAQSRSPPTLLNCAYCKALLLTHWSFRQKQNYISSVQLRRSVRAFRIPLLDFAPYCRQIFRDRCVAGVNLTGGSDEIQFTLKDASGRRRRRRRRLEVTMATVNVLLGPRMMISHRRRSLGRPNICQRDSM